jgi:hypothetical protein
MAKMATVVDKSVRDASEIKRANDVHCTFKIADLEVYDAEQFDDIEHVFGTGLEFEFDKLNVYGVGGHFKPHTDTPSPGVLGSLVVVLANEFTGGELVIRHNGTEAVFKRDGIVAFFCLV